MHVQPHVLVQRAGEGDILLTAAALSLPGGGSRPTAEAAASGPGPGKADGCPTIPAQLVKIIDCQLT